jgi:hypothetical protein
MIRNIRPGSKRDRAWIKAEKLREFTYHIGAWHRL